MTERLDVQVFPISPDRWIAVIDAPLGPFSTEAVDPDGVREEVARSVLEVLGRDVPFELCDDLGEPWSSAEAGRQLERLGSALESRPDGSL